MFPLDAEDRCYGKRSTPSHRSRLSDPMQRIYLDLVCGADEPDRERNPLKNDRGVVQGLIKLWENHKSDPAPFAVEEFNAAVVTYQRRGQLGTVAYAKSAAHLGRSLHMLADAADATVGLSRTTQHDLREHAKGVVAYNLKEWTKGPYPERLRLELDDIRWRPPHNPQTPVALVHLAAQEGKEQAATIKKILREASGESQVSRTHAVITKLVHRIIFMQEAWVVLYLRAIGAS